MPEKDYDEDVKTSAFSGLKKSPPPRRASTHALAEDDDGARKVRNETSEREGFIFIFVIIIFIS